MLDMNADAQDYPPVVATVAQPDASLSVDTKVFELDGSFVVIVAGTTVLAAALAYLCFRVERLVRIFKDD